MSSLEETLKGTSISSDPVKSLAIEKLKRILGDKGFTDDGNEMTPFLTEWRGFYSGDALLIVFPENVQMVSSIIKICAGRIYQLYLRVGIRVCVEERFPPLMAIPLFYRCQK